MIFIYPLLTFTMSILTHLWRVFFDIFHTLLRYGGMFFLGLFILIQVFIRRFTSWVWTNEWATRFMPITASQPYSFSTTDDWIRAMTIWDTSKTALLLLHGWFGWLRHWREFSSNPDIYNNYYLIIPERPGFSNQSRMIATSIQDEASMFLPFLEWVDESVVFGISYGASGAWYLCSISESCTHYVWWAWVFFAEHHITYKWFNLLEWHLWKLLLSHVFYQTWRENLVKDEYLAKIEPLYKKFSKPTLLFHAIDDWIVPYENSEKLLNTISSPQKKLIRTDGIRHQLQDAIPVILFEKINEFVKSR